jgi:hypothetical protein
MWQLVNHTRFAAERCFARDARGAEVWLVAVRGTFRIEGNGKTEVAEAQDPVAVSPTYQGEIGRLSLRGDTDLGLAKPGTDVLVLGHAYAPTGKPATRVDIGLRVDRIAKMLTVVGDRLYRRGTFGVLLSEPEPFTRMPVTYERAFGGIDVEAGPRSRDPRNPAGVGFAERAERLIGQRAPNIEIHGKPITSAKDRPEPAGFGAIARDWEPRLHLAGTYDAAWEEHRMPLLPLDFDERFYLAAPEDQQVPGYLREGSLVEVLHMTADGLLRFQLPKTRPVFRTFFGRNTVEHRGRLHTVIIEPDDRLVKLVWHTALPCHGKEHQLDRTLISEKAYV